MVEDEVDTVAIVRLGRPCQLLDVHQRIIGREGKTGVGYRIGIALAVGILIARLFE